MDEKRRKISDQGNNSSSCSSSSSSGGEVAYNVPIRTLHVAAVKPDMDDQIKMYFEQFGTVNSVETRVAAVQQDTITDTHFAVVEFNLAKAAAAVLASNGMHRIGSCDVQVKAAEPWQQPDHILNALDDDCLRSILLQLDLFDLTNAANVCVRFNQQAKPIFSTNFKEILLNVTYDTYKEMKNSLQTFGPLAQSVEVTTGYHQPTDDNGEQLELEIKILTMIDRCCTSTLKELLLHGVHFENEFDSALSTIEVLSFTCCSLRNSINAFLFACTELKVLRMDDCILANVDMWKFENTALPKLEELRLAYNTHMNNRILNGIIHSKLKLKKFCLFGYSYDRNAWNTTRDIVQHCPNLVELELEMNVNTDAQYAESVHRLQQLTSLKVLKLTLNGKSITPLSTVLTSNAAPIEHLKLHSGVIHAGSIENISKMEQLKVLELDWIHGFTDEHLIELAKGLGSKLEKLRLEESTATNLSTIGLKKMLPFTTKLSLLQLESSTITIDVDDYKAMLCTLQKRPEKIKLLLEIYNPNYGKNYENQVKVDKQVQKENSDWFHIKTWFI